MAKKLKKPKRDTTEKIKNNKKINIMNYNRTNIKLSFFNNETKFFVNEEKGTVACKVYACVMTPWANGSIVGLPYGMIATGVGVAKCMEGDTFDVERGKRIALAKAENKAYLEALDQLVEYRNELDFFTNAINEFEDKTYHCCAHNEEFIQSLSYEAHPKYKKDLKPLKRGL